ncbi:MAG: proteasome accessory factor C [Ilumatobacter sp.]|jgi:proteasome accessory factor C
MKGPRNAEDRLSRLLVMLPWLMEQGEVPLVEVAARFDLTAEQVQDDLELVAMCGLPPFVDEMIDVFVDDGLVFVGVPRLFTRPLRLTAPEGFSLLASARAAMELPGADRSGPLGRALDKLARALTDVGVETVGSDDTAGVAIDMSRPEATDEVVDAVAAAAELTMLYYSPARDERAERVIVPRHVFVDAGNWYVVADDAKSNERRTFRIDRIDSVTPTGRVVPTDDPVVGPPGFFADAELPHATLRLAPAAQWIIDRYPVGAVTQLTRPKGWIEVDVPVANERWLARLLIRLGPDVVVRSPKDAAQQASDLAARMLACY